jgi:hypothetical protein
MRYFIVSVVLLFLCPSCLEEFDFDTEAPEDIIVVDGTFTDSEEVDEVRLAYAMGYGVQTFLPVLNAQLTLFDEHGNSEALLEVDKGVYQFAKSELVGEIGTAYYLDILLPDGRRYQSTPEVLRAAPAIDSLSFDVERLEEVNDFGRLVDVLNFQLLVQTTINEEQRTDFLRWEIEHVYSYTELMVSPLSLPKTCYVKEENLNQQDIPIFDGRAVDGNTTIQEQVASKRMDFTFGYAQSYRVSQYAMSEAAYIYREQIDQISNNVGNIFDLPPAPVKGNIVNVNDPVETVLGYFSVSGVTRSTLFVTKGEVVDFYRPLDPCGANAPSGRPPNFCFSCFALSNSSTDRPFYW